MNLWQSLLAGCAMGFLSAGHCLGMCGPIAFFIGAGGTSARGFSRIAPFLWLGAGKALTYGWIGLLFGFAGHMLTKWGRWMGFAMSLPLVSGIGLILIGLWIAGLFPKAHLRLTFLESRVAAYMNSFKKPQSPAVLLCGGILWGFLPCPMVLVPALGSAVSGGVSGLEGAIKGFVMMAGFGAGTVPALAVSGLGGGELLAKMKRRMSPGWVGLCLAAGGVLLIVFSFTMQGAHAKGCCALAMPVS